MICKRPYRPGSQCTGYCPESSLSALLSVCSCSLLFLDVAEEHLALGNVRVGIADACSKIIRYVARYDPRIAPMPRQADFVDILSLDEERLEAFGDQRIDLHGTSRAAYDDAVAVLDPFSIGQRAADFNESMRHKAHEPWHVAAHGAGLPVF